MANEMKFRDELLVRLVVRMSDRGQQEPMSMAEVHDLVGFVDDIAKTACKQWGHDEVEFYLNAPGTMTVAHPGVTHRHYRCRRCGRELKES